MSSTILSAKRVARLLIGVGHSALRLGPLGDHDDRRVLALVTALDVVADPLDLELELRDQDHVGPAGDSGVEGDPSGVPAHHLDDQGALVALGGGVETVDCLHRDVDGGVEPEGVVGGAEVVVDRLRDADQLNAPLQERGGDAERVLTPDRDQSVHPGGREVLEDPLSAPVLLQRVRSRGAEDGAPAREDPADLRDAERPAVPLQRPPPSVPVADELVPVLPHPLANDRADHRVQPRTVAPAGKYPDPHRLSLPRRRRSRPPRPWEGRRRRPPPGRADRHRRRRRRLR